MHPAYLSCLRDHACLRLALSLHDEAGVVDTVRIQRALHALQGRSDRGKRDGILVSIWVCGLDYFEKRELHLSHLGKSGVCRNEEIQ